MFFSTGGPFSRQPRAADLRAARLGRRGIDWGPAGRESRPRPRTVVRAARSQSRKNRVSFAGRPSGSAGPSRRRESRSARKTSLKKKVQSMPYIYPMNSDLLCDSSRNTPPHVDLTRESHPSMCTHHADAGSTEGGCRYATKHGVAVSYEFMSAT